MLDGEKALLVNPFLILFESMLTVSVSYESYPCQITPTSDPLARVNNCFLLQYIKVLSNYLLSNILGNNKALELFHFFAIPSKTI